MNTSATTRTCYRCGSGDHLSRDCPQPAGGSNTRKHSAALADWKYIKPANLTTTKTDDLGRVWKFCTKCKCWAINKIGYNQLSHLDSAHLDNYRAHQRAAATNQPASYLLDLPVTFWTPPVVPHRTNLLHQTLHRVICQEMPTLTPFLPILLISLHLLLPLPLNHLTI